VPIRYYYPRGNEVGILNEPVTVFEEEPSEPLKSYLWEGIGDYDS